MCDGSYKKTTSTSLTKQTNKQTNKPMSTSGMSDPIPQEKRGSKPLLSLLSFLSVVCVRGCVCAPLILSLFFPKPIVVIEGPLRGMLAFVDLRVSPLFNCLSKQICAFLHICHANHTYPPEEFWLLDSTRQQLQLTPDDLRFVFINYHYNPATTYHLNWSTRCSNSFRISICPSACPSVFVLSVLPCIKSSTFVGTQLYFSSLNKKAFSF
ncbi:MAG: hypothetical protein J3R72DRAFT_191487 [Linnemannia gamsii]|nr:MAG: hypothetical protein J3R72DRAFT_191487 [Linnemannia gamsii]